MRDWQAYVRAHLALPDLTEERQTRIVRELAAQLEDFYRDAVASGLSEDDADRHAQSQVTDWSAIARDVRRADRSFTQPRLERMANALDATPGPTGGVLQMFAHVLRDVRFALRQLTKAPGFSTVAILTLALGIGATTAIFSVVNGVLLRPLPYPDPDALVRVHETIPQYGRFSVAPATFLDWRDQNTSFDRLAVYGGSSATFAWSSGPERVPGAVVSWDMFPLLRATPTLGGNFTPEQDAPGGDNVIIISHGLWQSRFGADPQVVGTTVTVNGLPTTILGVMPPDFYFPTRAVEYWMPIALNPSSATRGGHYLGVVGRLKDGVRIEQANTEMAGISERLGEQYPDASAGESAEVVSLKEQVVGRIRPALITLLIAVGVVVLIACANVANLLLVRASVREKEVAIRTALGAGRQRLVFQMLAESLVLAVVAGVLGLALAYAAIPAIQTLSAGSIPRVADVTIDGTVLAFTLAASMVTGILFGLVPAWQSSRTGTSTVLKEGGRSSVGSGGRWMRNALLVAEVALSVVLLVGAALLLRSFDKLTSVDPGFNPQGVLAFQLALPGTAYPDSENQISFYDRLLDRLATVPSVTAASSVQTLPMGGGYVLTVQVSSQPPAKPGEEPSAHYRAISPDYFKTLEIPLVRGRAFTAQDRADGAPVAIVDEAFVAKHFPNDDPIGERIDIGNGTNGAEIVGIVGNVSYNGLEAEQTPTMYVPQNQAISSSAWVLVRTAGEPAALSQTVRQIVGEFDSTLPTANMNPLTTTVDNSVAQQRFSMLLIVLFGGVALFMASVGLYGVVAYSVSLRNREIGLRMAIGAQPGDVLKMVIGGGMKLAAIGVVLGVVGALALSRLVASMLFEVAPSDPTSYVATAGTLLVIAALACYIPARRAMGIDPMVTLQQD